MNKYFKFMSVAAVALLAAACSSDEPNDGPNTGADKDGQAFMKVRINYADGGRATAGDFEYGKDYEHAISNARFFFYDAAGNYVAKANVWDGGNANEEKPDENIEYFGNNVLVLNGLDKKGYPKYMLTVLNAPDGFESEATMVSTARKLTLAAGADEKTGGIYGKDGNFLMSTTSYARSDKDEPAYVTVLNEGNFFLEPHEATGYAPVQVYVERLAVKVALGLDESKLLAGLNDKGLYELNVTVADKDNNDPDGIAIGATKLYVKINGWGLSNTRKNSYLSKDIDGLANPMTNGFDWNAATFYRSWWGKSYGYDKAVQFNAVQGTSDLNTYAYSDLTKKLVNVYQGDEDAEGYKAFVDYCAENTNTVDNIKASALSVEGKELVNPAAVTVVLVNATVCDAEGNGLDLVEYNGMYFTDEAFRDYGMRYLKEDNKLGYYTKATVDGKDVYTQLNGDYVKVVKKYGASVVELAPDTEAFKDVTLYTKNGDTYEAVADNATALATLTANLKDFTKDVKAVGYKGGAMYYQIPVEHLFSDGDDKKISEGEYGVVRNHFYQLNITSISRLGHGVFDPDTETIIPDEPEDPKYYLGAEVNVLSWKVVKQDVPL